MDRGGKGKRFYSSLNLPQSQNLHLHIPTAPEERHSTVNHGMVSEEFQMQTTSKLDKGTHAWGLRKGPGSAGIIGGFGPSSISARKVGGFSYELL